MQQNRQSRQKIAIWILAALTSACSSKEALKGIGEVDAKALTPVQLASPMTPTASYSDEEQANITAAIGAIGKRPEFAAITDAKTRALAIARAVQAEVPQVHDAGVTSRGDTWIRLKDGSPIVIFDDTRQASSAGGPDPLSIPMQTNAPVGRELRRHFAQAIDRVIPEARAQFAQSSEYALPKTKKAYLAQIDNLGGSAATRIQQYLARKSYAVTYENQPSLANWRTQISGVGVFWVSTHGVEYPGSNGVEKYGLVNGEPADGKCAKSAQECTETRADLAAGRTFRGVLRTTGKAFFVVGPEWVEKYWTFAEKSLLFLDACDSMTATFAGSEFLAALKAKKAGLLLGWIDKVEKNYAQRAATFFFDRVTGANDYTPLSPKQRPFSAIQVLNAMKAKGLDLDPSGTARLSSSRNMAEELILTPSVRNVNVDEDEGTAELYGEFGNEPGLVEINGSGLTTRSWANHRVLVTLPASGAQSKGLVSVKLNGIQSNEVPITEWVGQFWGRNYFDEVYGAPGPYFEGNCSRVRVRADIHVYREEPEQEARAGWMDDLHGYSPEVHFTHVNRETTCDHTSGGFGIRDDGLYERYKHEFSGGTGTAVWTKHADSGGTNFLIAVGKIKPKEKQITLNLNTRTPGMVIQTTTQIPACPPEGGCSPPGSGPIGRPSLGHIGYAMSSRLYALDANYNLPQVQETFRFTFGMVDLGSLPPGIEIPQTGWGPVPSEKAEIRWNLNADPATIPTSDTPG